MIDIHFERHDGSKFNLRFKKLNTVAGNHWYVKMVTAQRTNLSFEFSASDTDVFESLDLTFGEGGEPLTEDELKDCTSTYKFGHVYVNSKEMTIDMRIKWQDAENQPSLVPVAVLSMPYSKDEINYMLVDVVKIIGVLIV